MLPDRLTRIDETTLGQHPHLEPDDRCYYFGEYFAGQSYRGGPTNQLIFNFKCKPTVAAVNAARRDYKAQAIATIAAGFSKAISRPNAEQYTWVPIPPSKVSGDPDYDDRMLQTLRRAFAGVDADVRPLLRQTVSTAADHEQAQRLTLIELEQILAVDTDVLNARPLRSRIILVDDVLTTGKHFKAAQRRLRQVLPEARIAGVFVARCVEPNPFEDLDAAP